MRNLLDANQKKQAGRGPIPSRRLAFFGCLIFLVVASVAVGFAIGSVTTALYLSSNFHQNRSSTRQGEMKEIACKWGCLAPFPDETRNFTIRTEGSPFTRTFVGSFEANPSVIGAWIDASPGIQEGVEEQTADGSVRWSLKMGGGASFGDVQVSPDRTRIDFSISWS